MSSVVAAGLWRLPPRDAEANQTDHPMPSMIPLHREVARLNAIPAMGLQPTIVPIRTAAAPAEVT